MTNPRYLEMENIASMHDLRPGARLRFHYGGWFTTEVGVVTSVPFLDGTGDHRFWSFMINIDDYGSSKRSLADMGIIPYSRNHWNDKNYVTIEPDPPKKLDTILGRLRVLEEAIEKLRQELEGQ